MNRSELLAPGGNLDSAMAALENGADAVYCGLQEFSARKGAKNFSFEQLSRLKAWCKSNGKKVYIALNTILMEEELPRVLGYLQRLEELEADSIILQDPGLARIISRHFPGLVMHGSTQMAVHDLRGLRILREMGFSRVVLPRELSMDEMRGFRRDIPEMELEVFIHGAQCYGFSGMCLASGMLLGRSANRGACGQICRTWFKKDGEKGYYLSSTDLWAGESVIELQNMGISSLKIEGRMKSPAYAEAVSRYYRAILDNRTDRIKDLEENLKIAFSRNSGQGHLTNPKGEEMVDTFYPGHRGLFLGRIVSSKGKQLTLAPDHPVSRRDGLMYLDRKGRARSFSADPLGGKNGGTAKITLRLPFQAPPPGTRLYKVQSHDAHSSAMNEKKYPVFKYPVPLTLDFKEDTVSASCREWKEWSARFILHSEDATGTEGPEGKIRAELAKSGDYSFVISDVQLSSPDRGLKNRFIPPSALKGFRRELYAALASEIEKNKQKRLESLESKMLRDREQAEAESGPRLPERRDLNPPGSDLPYGLAGEELAEHEGVKWMPLPPLILAESEKEIAQPEGACCIGINNWGHISRYREWKKENPELQWYGDTGMLLANSQSFLLLQELLKEKGRGAYGWLEANGEALPLHFSRTGAGFRPPLFISRNCFKKHSLKENCKGCGRDLRYSLEQNGKDYDVFVKDCLTWIFAADGSGKKDSSAESPGPGDQ